MMPDGDIVIKQLKQGRIMIVGVQIEYFVWWDGYTNEWVVSHERKGQMRDLKRGLDLEESLSHLSFGEYRD
jgi:hypothetical protein